MTTTQATTTTTIMSRIKTTSTSTFSTLSKAGSLRRRPSRRRKAQQALMSMGLATVALRKTVELVMAIEMATTMTTTTMTVTTTMMTRLPNCSSLHRSITLMPMRQRGRRSNSSTTPNPTGTTSSPPAGPSNSSSSFKKYSTLPLQVHRQGRREPLHKLWTGNIAIVCATAAEEQKGYFKGDAYYRMEGA